MKLLLMTMDRKHGVDLEIPDSVVGDMLDKKADTHLICARYVVPALHALIHLARRDK